MYLKALNVVGFKSFADKTQVQFHPGVTAIVGPNGCGKSNVLDSIRWVLGEQSAKALRGGQMQDVIFNGAETRKPLGMAEVSLTFGDCEGQLGGTLGADYNEVTITRRLFRDGASEYEINKNPCRLRDIHQLFMDTGVGRTAYSIMEQGKIDQILSARPEDRRAVFEEAAGITKFKSQKKEAMRKLENTDANLLRLEDIVGEVRRQIASLQRQATKARRYQEIFAELKEAELKLARHQYGLLTAEILMLQERGDSSRDAHSALTLAVEEEDRALGALRSELELLEFETAKVRDLLNEARMASERGAQKEKTNTLRVEEFSVLRENCRVEIAGTDEKVRIQDEQLAELTVRLENQATARLEASNAYHAKEQEVRGLEERVSEKESARAEKNHELASSQSRISNLRNQRVALEAQQKSLLLRGESLRSEQDALALRREEAEARRTAQLEEVAQAGHVLEEVRVDVAARQEAVVETQQAVAAKQQVVAERQQGIAAAQQAVAEKQQAVGERQRLVAEREQAVRTANDLARDAERAHRDLATAHARVAAKLDTLKQMEASHAGSPPAAQHLLACSARGEVAARLQGTLSDHFQVASGAETAIALLLGEAFNALVVDDRAGAEELLRKVAEQGDGQVLLAPLGLARPSGGSGAPTSARLAVEVPNPAQVAISDLLDALLADAHIVETVEQAWALKAAQPQAVVATRDGVLLNRPGLIQAGKGTGEASGLAVLARRTERRGLEDEVAAAAEAVEAGASRVAEAGAGVQAAQLQVQEAQLRVEEARAAVQEAQNGVEEAQAFVAEARGFVQEAQNAVQEAQAHVAEAQGAVRDAEIQAATRRHTQETLIQAVAELDRNAERIGQEAARVATQVEADGQRFEGIDQSISQAEGHSSEVQEALSVLQDEVTALEQEEASKRQDLVESQIALGALTHQHQAVAQQQFTVQQRLAELKELAATRTREADEHAGRIAQAEEEIAAAQVEQETAAVSIAEHEMEVQGRIVERSTKLELINQREAALRIERRKLAEAQSQQTECEVRLTERRIGLNHLVERVQAAYQLVLAELPPLSEEEAQSDWPAIEAQVAEQRERIDSMGPVNIEAIAEFEELQERLTFLEGQEADLRNGKEQLLQAIQEINQTTEKMFAETFEQVKANFQQLFGELFGGGKASLHLSDDKDPLESGIEIMAKPPGKQPQSITLLSGGEKTMTAVALLFAIYMVKPSPFCVLDELDAPLDESNINRFINIVKRFNEHSQFVVITHNKRTISMADAIFGVTMQERGVSRLMSVKLTPDDEFKPRARQTAPKKAAEAPAAPALEPEAEIESEGGVAVLEEEPPLRDAALGDEGADDDGPALES